MNNKRIVVLEYIIAGQIHFNNLYMLFLLDYLEVGFSVILLDTRCKHDLKTLDSPDQ